MPFVQKHLGEGGGFGHDLRELRELRGLSYEDLSAITKIHVSVLAALEEERIADLSDPLYAERLVRAVVLALEGRPAYFLKKYRDLLEAAWEAPTETAGLRRTVRRRDFFVTSRVVALLGFLALVGLAAGYLIWQGHALQNAPSLVVTSPVEGLRLESPHVDVSGTTDPEATVTVNGRPAVVDRDGRFSLSFDVPRGLTTMTIEARRRYGSSVVETRRVTYQREDAPITLPIDNIHATGTQTTSTNNNDIP